MPKANKRMTERECEICSRVKEYRELIKWPQPAFAYELGLTRDKLASIEYGRTPLRHQTAFMMCSVFDVNPVWLATGKAHVVPNFGDGEFLWPGNVPDNLLFSATFDSAFGNQSISTSGVPIKTKSRAENEVRSEPQTQLTEPATHVIQCIVKLFDSEKFTNLDDKSRFAQNIVRLVRSISLERRRRRVRSQIRIIRDIGGLNLAVPGLADLVSKTPQQTAKIMNLRRRIATLQAELLMLESGE